MRALKHLVRSNVRLFQAHSACPKFVHTTPSMPEPADDADISPSASSVTEYNTNTFFDEEVYLSNLTTEELLLHDPEEMDELTASEMAIRDVSGLRPYHRYMAKNKPPPMDMYTWQWDRTELKKRYAMYGQASGVNPNIAWPTQNDLQEKKMYEEHREPQFWKTFHEAKRLREEREQFEAQRLAKVEENLRKYPKILAEYHAELDREEKERVEAQKIRDQMVTEIYEHFGYEVPADDPRFQAMVTKREEDENKVAKLAKREEKKQARIASIEKSVKTE